MSNIFADLQAESERQQQVIETPEKKKKRTSDKTNTQQVTRNITQERGMLRDNLREKSRDISSGNLRERPSRDEIQEFSFRLRDDLKVKVQAEVPHQWQGELEETARNLNVKKLELYRYIIGRFLGKV